MAHVACDEDARYVCFEQIGLAFERPVARTTAIKRKISAGENVTTLVTFNQICDAGGVRRCADKNEKSHRRRGCGLPRLIVRDGDAFEVVFAVCLDHTRLQLHYNVWCECELVNEVLRHAFRKRITTRQELNATSKSRKIHCRLARRVSRADDVDILV